MKQAVDHLDIFARQDRRQRLESRAPQIGRFLFWWPKADVPGVEIPRFWRSYMLEIDAEQDHPARPEVRGEVRRGIG